MLKRLLYLGLLLIIFVSSARAEVVVLRSGQRIKGEILLNDGDVVILRKKDGSRYQYPKTEIIDIQEDIKLATNTPDSTRLVKKQTIAARIAMAGGTAYIPYHGWGGIIDAQMMVGTHKLLNQSLFLGGSIGYRGVFGGNNTYSWLPLQLVLQSPITIQPNTPHSLLLGVSCGYAFAISKQWGSGLCTGIDVGWWYHINNHSSLSIACTAQWQQTRIDIIETIENYNLTKSTQHIDYINHIGCNIIGLGLKIGLQF